MNGHDAKKFITFLRVQFVLTGVSPFSAKVKNKKPCPGKTGHLAIEA
jgi:hypothetical protein